MADIDLSGFGLERTAFVGKGHYGSVQLVRDTNSGRTFVAKCVKLGALNEADRKLAHQEVFLLEALHHPFIVEYHDSFLVEGQGGEDILVILMGHCAGGDLRQAIAAKAQAGESFSEAQVMTWFAQLVQALQHIHSERVMHRDLKCSNVFLVGDGTLKLGDFGISRVFEGSKDAAITLVGTPYYMSPEVCSSEAYSYKADIWSLGCILYELCALKHAFQHETLQGLVHNIKSAKYGPIPSSYSAELQDLIRRLLNPVPSSRLSCLEIIALPLVQQHINPQVANDNLPTDAETRQRGKELRKGGTLQRLDSMSLSMSAGSTSSITMPDLGPQDMSLILASRLARALELRSALASLDPANSGAVSVNALQSLLSSDSAGMSDGETTVFMSSLPKSDGKVLNGAVESKVADAGAAPKIQQLWTWAKQALGATDSLLAMSLEARDRQRSGQLSVQEFQAALKEVSPQSNVEELMVLMLLADKNKSGDILYSRCLSRFSVATNLAEDSFFTCATGDLRVIQGAVMNAW
eukprot:TRINITY_DN65614_c0_g1_i1.p1 TRINITY_DN65614_c0_g1~~TRINITY_DN65614_c0_g1_i1.p1  ORF type:complete len:531 (+),score=117.88 TRINITY_DN65614_c0_g1_i1:25-1593(+)